MTGHLIIDLQLGSTGKGSIAGHLAKRTEPDTVVTAWAANAGHTYINDKGRKYVHTMLANGVVSPKLKRVMIGPGSLINPTALAAEINECMRFGHISDASQVLVHPHAAVITDEHIDAEYKSMTAIGSTKKGVGEAAIQRIKRNVDNQNTAIKLLTDPCLPFTVLKDTEQWLNALGQAETIQVEGAQGYSLSMYHGFYPYTTSRDVSTAQVLADCAIPFEIGKKLTVIGTVRSYPIRVANRFDESGKQIGWSGPCYNDQVELDWKDDLGINPELTTVTKLPRRIFTFSMKQLKEAVQICGVDQIFYNFANYHSNKNIMETMIRAIDRVARVKYVGFGATDLDIIELDRGWRGLDFVPSNRYLASNQCEIRGARRG